MPEDEVKKWEKFRSTHNYARNIGGAETHWYFIEGDHSFREGLYIASCLCFINGIESSIRTLLMYINEKYETLDSKTPNLNNDLIRKTMEAGMDVSILAFPNELDFLEKIKAGKPKVELVRTRHNICHGNVFEYIQSSDGAEKTFSPESMKATAAILKNICEPWSKEIFRFKNEYVKV